MKNVIKKFSRELEVVAALAVIMVVFGVIQPIYFSPSNLLDICLLYTSDAADEL